jgi:hypothetical protein
MVQIANANDRLEARADLIGRSLLILSKTLHGAGVADLRHAQFA